MVAQSGFVPWQVAHWDCSITASSAAANILAMTHCSPMGRALTILVGTTQDEEELRPQDGQPECLDHNSGW